MSENQPVVSVITPCYNSARFVGETVASLQAQLFSAWEQIVIDDGSDDFPETVLEPISKSDARVRFVHKKNGGVSSARNAGLVCLSETSQYLLFLDADDCLEPSFFTEMTQYLDAHPHVSVVYCDPIFINESGEAMMVSSQSQGRNSLRFVPTRYGVRTVPDDEPETPFCSVFTLTTIIPSLALFRRSVFEQTPGWDENFGHVCEDTDLLLQMTLHGEIHYLPRPLMRYRRHSGQSTANIERIGSQGEKLYKKWADTSHLTSEQKQIVQDAIKFREGKFAAYKGVSQGAEHFRHGRIIPAVRFWGGAAKRWVRAVCTG